MCHHLTAADGGVTPLELPSLASDPDGWRAAVEERVSTLLLSTGAKLQAHKVNLQLLALGA